MRKAIITSVLLMAAGYTSAQSDTATPKHMMCTEIYSHAELIMMSRQLAPSAEKMQSDMAFANDPLEKRNKDAAAMFRMMVVDAYQSPQSRIPSEMPRIVKEFGAKWGAKCWASPLATVAYP